MAASLTPAQWVAKQMAETMVNNVKANMAQAVRAAEWAKFKKRFPRADTSRFRVETDFEENGRASADVLYVSKDGDGNLVFDEQGKLLESVYMPEGMKKALGLESGFPLALTVTPVAEHPIPAVAFSGSVSRVGGALAKQKIWVTPKESFNADFRDIFTHTKIKFTSGHEANKWLGGPNICYWPQQLSFAFWCATTGCGVSRRILFEKDTDHELNLTVQIRAFFKFHVYFTTRRILYEMGGIQSVSALPGDPTFSQTNNAYDPPSYHRLCAEFGIDSSSDFRFSEGANHGLGKVFVYVTNVGPDSSDNIPYPSKAAKFSDEGGTAEKGNLVYFIRNDAPAVESQFDFFVPDESHGLTQAGLARLNQSIEAFVYCVLGSQVNVRSSILGFTGSAKEAQREFLVLMEDAIRQPDISTSVQRFQLAIDEAKVRLDLAISPGTWLMPSKLVINTASAVGYNNQLKRAAPGMKLGVNNGVNTSTKKVGVTHMEGGPSKTNRPTGHPSNPIHKADVAAQSGKKAVADSKAASAKSAPIGVAPQQAKESTYAVSAHDSNKIVLIAAAALGAFAVARFAL